MRFTNKILITGLTLFFLLSGLELFSQIPTHQDVSKAQKELEEKGISEAEVEKRMLMRGYDVNNLDPVRFPEYKAALDEVIAEIEAENQEKAEQEKKQEESAKSSEEDKDISNIEEQREENVKVAEKEGSKEEKAAEKRSESIKIEDPDDNIYGHSIFTQGQLSLYRAAEDISTPENYVLGTGDEILISIFGRSQADFKLTINKEGYIKPPGNTPMIFLKGVKLKDARKLLINRMRLSYSFLPEQFSATLITARTVTLNIFGEVGQPGSYTISALNTGFNAVLAAGGMTRNGSVRNIKLIKGDGKELILDVYQYLSDPRIQFDFPIDDKDILYVPLSGNIVSITGAVRRPMKYEMLEGETLKDLIRYSGGLRSNAYTKLAQISRLSGENRILIDIPLEEYLNREIDFTLRDGDLITIKTVDGELRDFVEINGHVEFPGQYDYTEGMTLADLVDKARFKELTRTDLAFLFRENEDKTVRLIKLDLDDVELADIELNNRDKLMFYSVRQFMDEQKEIEISGAVRNPSAITFNPDDKVKLADLITYAGGLLPNAHGKAMLTRIDRSNKQKLEYLEIDVFQALADTAGNENVLLYQGDKITIYAVEQFAEAEEIEIRGEVRDPRSLRYDESLGLQEAILMAGGLKKNASNIAIIRSHSLDNSKSVSYQRVNLDEVFAGESEVILKPRDVVRIYDKNVYLEDFQVSVMGEVREPGKFTFDESLTIEDLIYMAGGLTIKAATNRVDLYRLDIMENTPTQILYKEIKVARDNNYEISVKDNITLQPYDIIIVRPVPDFEFQEVVYINGQVQYPGPYIMDRNKTERVRDLIKRSGGVKKDAFIKGATLVRSSGNRQGNIVIDLSKAMSGSSKSFDNIVLRNGDIIYIPKIENTISIRTTGTLAKEVLDDSSLEAGMLQMAFQGKKSAKWYIKNYAGGFAENADKNSVRVVYPGGRIASTKKVLGFIRDYPSVVEGGTVIIDMKPPKPEKEKKEKEDIDWNVFLRDTIAVVTSVVTLLVLLNQLNK